ncbi:MAG: hypothetical protein IPL25_16930 [Saprospiraceae bacterium]|nr:hypothetical protein [Candidatus Vicinibacter affinis]
MPDQILNKSKYLKTAVRRVCSPPRLTRTIPEFCHLHCHTQFSLLDGATDIRVH